MLTEPYRTPALAGMRPKFSTATTCSPQFHWLWLKLHSAEADRRVKLMSALKIAATVQPRSRAQDAPDVKEGALMALPHGLRPEPVRPGTEGTGRRGGGGLPPRGSKVLTQAQEASTMPLMPGYG